MKHRIDPRRLVLVAAVALTAAGSAAAADSSTAASRTQAPQPSADATAACRNLHSNLERRDCEKRAHESSEASPTAKPGGDPRQSANSNAGPTGGKEPVGSAKGMSGSSGGTGTSTTEGGSGKGSSGSR